MTTIRNLVTMDEQAEFRNDVQISDYENEETNLSLLQSYLFTVTAPQGQESSSGLLRAITESYLNPRLDNRIAVIANYGHGKSHLALVLANYFGKPFQSQEMQIVLSKLSQALGNPAQAQRYREFRENRAEFLVIRLRGDKSQSLREQFVLSLEQSMREHESTKIVELPFWYQKAESLLRGLSGEMLSKANRYLENYSTDVPLLIQDVKNRKDAAYDLCRKLFTELHGVAPDFRGEVSVRELINWVSQQYCGDSKPLGGLFVLFDEFSLYVKQYGQRNAAGELQDLLNGIEDQKGKAVFLAFAQHSPIQVARNTLRAGSNLETLEHELTRIPRELVLYSLMESVINAYLSQPDRVWNAFRSDSSVRGPVARASNLAMDLFTKRYEQTLRWDTEKFDEIVTKGCFPLHPLTTALLCDLKLQAMGSAGNPRTVLGFVFEQVKQKGDELAIEQGQINWVLPIYLVDYFNEYLPENSLLLYENARRSLAPDAPSEHENLLKALLLQDLARLPVRRDTQIGYLAEAAGLRVGDAEKSLRKLSDSRTIRYDQNTKMYSFWPVAANPHRMEEIIEQRLQGRGVTWDLLSDINKSFVPVPVDVAWGHQDDWEASEQILTLDYFTPQRLRELIPLYQMSSTGELTEGKRGCLIWLVGETDEEVLTLKQTAPRILDETFPGDNPPAIVLILPTRPHPNLFTTFIKNQIVEDFSQDDRREVGTEIYEHEKGRLKQSLTSEIANVRGDLINYRTSSKPFARYAVPSAYRAPLQVFGDIGIYRLLKELYNLAYRFSPPEFFTEFQVIGRGQNKLRNAASSVASVLLRNSLSSNREAIIAQPVAKRLCENFLQIKWQLVSADYRIREPGQQHLLEAWNQLEQAFPAGAREKRVRSTLVSLLNPPFGFDYNTVTLLFCAWIGYHSHDLQISGQGRVMGLDKLAEVITSGKNAKLVFQAITSELNLTITRRDPGQILREVQEIIEKVNHSNFKQDVARDAITKLDEFCREQPSDSPMASNAKQAAENLRAALGQAERYDQQALEIQKSIRSEKSIEVVLNLHQRITGLQRSTLVLQTGPQESDLHEKWLTRLSQMVEDECATLEAVQRRTQVEANQNKLQDLKKQLKKANQTNLIERVDRALKTITEKDKSFEAQEREAPLQAEIRTMDTRSGLKTLYSYRDRLQQIKGASEATMFQRNERLRLIEQEINNLEQFAKQLSGAIARIDMQDALTDWQRQLFRNYDRYVDTPYQSELDEADRKGKHLLEYLQTLNTISRRTPTSPEDAFSVIRELDTLINSSKNGLSQVQLSLVEKSKQRIENLVQKQINDAKNWYRTVEVQYNQGSSLHSVRECLLTPPSFLPGDERTRLELLKQEVEQRLEQDIIGQIEARFRQIKDPEKRAQCIERLQKILEDA